MAAARYVVVKEPGAPITGVGFVRAGEAFSAPSPGYMPSKTFRPLNKEAQDVLGGMGVKVDVLVPDAVEPPVEKVLDSEGLDKLKGEKTEKASWLHGKPRASDKE